MLGDGWGGASRTEEEGKGQRKSVEEEEKEGQRGRERGE